MNKMEIEERIQQQISNSEISSWHGISKDNIGKYLVEPKKIQFKNAYDEKVNEYWVVLDEDYTDATEGYQIIYDEGQNVFGLATKTSIVSKEIGVAIGFYGSFIDALNSM